VTFCFVVLTGLLFGFSQMGDCFPEPSVLAQCLSEKDSTGHIILFVCVIIYVIALWFLFRRRKSH